MVWARWSTNETRNLGSMLSKGSCDKRYRSTYGSHNEVQAKNVRGEVWQ